MDRNERYLRGLTCVGTYMFNSDYLAFIPAGHTCGDAGIVEGMRLLNVGAHKIDMGDRKHIVLKMVGDHENGTGRWVHLPDKAGELLKIIAFPVEQYR